jgi:hypothetical protein
MGYAIMSLVKMDIIEKEMTVKPAWIFVKYEQRKVNVHSVITRRK